MKSCWGCGRDYLYAKWREEDLMEVTHPTDGDDIIICPDCYEELCQMTGEE